MNLETPNDDINQDSDSVSENITKDNQHITPSIDPLIQSNRSSKSKSNQIIEKQLTPKQLRQQKKQQRKLVHAKKRAYYKSAAFRRTYTYQRIEEAREARGLPRDPRERIVKSAHDAGHLLWTRF